MGNAKAARPPQSGDHLRASFEGLGKGSCTFSQQLEVISISESPAISHSYQRPHGNIGANEGLEDFPEAFGGIWGWEGGVVAESCLACARP